MENAFSINDEPLSKACKVLGLNTFIQVCNYVKQLPYGRNSNRSDYTLILKEKKGTCSTKHAFLKQIAIENGQQSINLYIGIYKMNALNTKGIGSVLEKHKLDYIPEAHCYLKIDNQIVDITRNVVSKNSFETSLLTEIAINPEQIGDFKLEYHKQFLKQWIKKESIPFTFKEIWTIREQCISNLSQ